MWPSFSRKRLALAVLVLVLVLAPIVAASQLFVIGGGGTNQHTNYGVSQLWAGHVGEERFPIRLFNPGPVTYIASILVYTAPQLGEPGNIEDFEPVTPFDPNSQGSPTS